MKNTKKTAFLSVFLVICLLLASCAVPSGDVSQKDGGTHLEALVAKNGSVYLYEASSQALEQVTSIDAEGTKASMSPDKKHIAYALPATAVEGETYLRLNIAVVNTETKAKKEISISSGGDLVYSTFWLDNSHVVVEAHLNPSVNVYSIVDIESGEKTDFQGTDGVSLGNGDILYIGGMNHFYPELLTGHICLNDKMIYDSKINGAFIEKLSVKGEKICFVVPDEENSESILVYGELDTAKKEFTPSIEAVLTGDLKHGTPAFNEKGEVRIISSDKKEVYLYDETKGAFEVSASDSASELLSEEESLKIEVEAAISEKFKESPEGYDIYLFRTDI